MPNLIPKYEDKNTAWRKEAEMKNAAQDHSYAAFVR